MCVNPIRRHPFQEGTHHTYYAWGGNTGFCGSMQVGDRIDTIEKHCIPFVEELRERVRNLLETSVGLEEMSEIAREMARKPN